MNSRALIRAVLIVSAAGFLASCGSSGPAVKFRAATKEFFSEREYGKASPRVVAYGPVPKGGGRSFVGAPYRVAGRTYIPSENPRYSATGLASWYGAAFHGRQTANGEVYDVNGLTAAHPTLPLPSYVRVTNLRNGRSMIVRVNDRGPFARDRIIDVSAKVAGMLGFKEEGTGKVRVDYMGPARMDGLDHGKLMASFREGGGGETMLAFGDPTLLPAPVPRVRPTKTPPPLVAGAAPLDLTPLEWGNEDDPLAPLILRSTFVNSYAADTPLTGAQQAAGELAASSSAEADLASALARAAERKALELRGTSAPADTIVQLGSFADPANAERVARDFRRFGTIDSHSQEVDGRELTVVRVTIDPSIEAGTVIDAAAGAGLSGAFVAN